jgi:tetratricopeptide (TPR) repeat protein
MSAQATKLIAVGFLKRPANSFMLQQCEMLYAYGVMSQLARFTTAHYKDMATLDEKITLTQELEQVETLKRLTQICKTTRSQYLFAGCILPAPPPQSAFEIHYRLFDARKNQYIISEKVFLQLFPKSSADENQLPYNAEEINQLINKTVSQFAQAMFGHNPSLDAEKLAPFSTSLNAMQLMLKAHQTVSAAEKIALYETATQEDIMLESAYFHLARIYKNESLFEKSVLFYRETLKYSNAAAHNKAIYATEAGISCALLGRPDLALQWWKRAVEYDPTYLNPYFNIANTFEDQEKFPEAEFFFLKAQELAPDDFRTFFNLARIYSKMGVWDKALTQYNFQLRTEDKDPWCHSDVATCYLNLGDLQNAKQHLEKTVTLDPQGEAGEYAQLILSSLG